MNTERRTINMEDEENGREQIWVEKNKIFWKKKNPN